MTRAERDALQASVELMRAEVSDARSQIVNLSGLVGCLEAERDEARAERRRAEHLWEIAIKERDALHAENARLLEVIAFQADALNDALKRLRKVVSEQEP
jgi:hypothetical protein